MNSTPAASSARSEPRSLAAFNSAEQVIALPGSQDAMASTSPRGVGSRKLGSFSKNDPSITPLDTKLVFRKGA